MKQPPLKSRLESLDNSTFPLASNNLPGGLTLRERAQILFDTFVGDVGGISFLDYAMDEYVMAEAAQRGAAFRRPFDKVLMFDVLDHLIDDPVEILKEVKTILSPKGSILLRCHPACSRHAIHPNYHNNKAYLHFFLTPEERQLLGISGLPIKEETIREPLSVYRAWFDKADYEVLYEEPIIRYPEQFFVFVAKKYYGNADLSPIQFVDYIVIPRAQA